VDGYALLQLARVLIGRVHDQLALSSYHPEAGDSGTVEAAGEAGQSLTARKPEDRGRGLFALPEPGVAIVGAEGHDLHRLRPIQISHGVDAIDTDVIEWASAELPRVEPDVTRLHLHGKNGIEKARVPQPAALNQVDRLEVCLLKVKPVGDHQLDPILLRSRDHGETVLFGHCHGFLAQNVDAGTRCPLGVLAMEMIGQCYVDGIDGAAVKALIKLFVRIPRLYSVPSAQPLEFLGIIRNEGGKLRVLCVTECRQHRHLRDVAQPYDPIPDLPLVCLFSVLASGGRHLVLNCRIAQGPHQLQPGKPL
jgi:hypothetical protein